MVPDTPLARPAPFLLPHAQFDWQAVANASAGWAWSRMAAASIALGSATSIEVQPSPSAGASPFSSGDTIAALARVDAMVPLTVSADVFAVDAASAASAPSPAWAVRSLPVAPGWFLMPYNYAARDVVRSLPDTLDWQTIVAAQQSPGESVTPVGIAANVSSVTWQITGVPIRGSYGLPAEVSANETAMLHNLTLSSPGLTLRLAAGTLRAAYVYVVTPVALAATAHWTADLSPLLSLWSEELGVTAAALVRSALLPGGRPSSITVHLCGQGIRLMTKAPPSRGTLTAIPTTGTAFTDEFRFSTTGWTAEASLFATSSAAAALTGSSDLATALASLAWPDVVASALARRLADPASPAVAFDVATNCTELSTPLASLFLTALPVPSPWWFTLASMLGAASGESGTRSSASVLCRQLLGGVGPSSASLHSTARPSSTLRFSFRVDTSGASPARAVVDASSIDPLVRALALVDPDTGLASQTTWPGLALSNLSSAPAWASLLSQNTSSPQSNAPAFVYVIGVDADGSAGIAFTPLRIRPLVSQASLPNIALVTESVGAAMDRVLLANASAGEGSLSSPFSTLYLLSDLGSLVSQSLVSAGRQGRPPDASIVSQALGMHERVAQGLVSTLQAASSSVPSGATGVPLSDDSLSQLSKFALGMAGVATSNAGAAPSSAASLQQLGLSAMQAALSLAQQGSSASTGLAAVSNGAVLPLDPSVAQTALDATAQLMAIPPAADEQQLVNAATDRAMRAVDAITGLIASSLTRGDTLSVSPGSLSIRASAVSPAQLASGGSTAPPPCITMALTVSRVAAGTQKTELQLDEPAPPCSSGRRRLQTAASEPLPVVSIDSARVVLPPGASSFTLAAVQWTADPSASTWNPTTPQFLPCSGSVGSTFCPALGSHVPHWGAAGQVLSVKLVDARGMDLGAALGGTGAGLVTVALQVDPSSGPAAVASQLASEPVPFSVVCPSLTQLSELAVPSFANVSASVPLGPPLGAGLPARLHSVTYRNVSVPTLAIDADAATLVAPPALGSGSELALDSTPGSSGAASDGIGAAVLVRAPYYLLEVECRAGSGGATPSAFVTCGYGSYGKRAGGACPRGQPVPVCARLSGPNGGRLSWTAVGASNASVALPAPDNVTCAFDAGGYVGLRWALVPSTPGSDVSVVDDLGAPTVLPITVTRSSSVLVAVLVVLATTLLLLPLAHRWDADGASRFYAALLDDEEVIFLRKLFELTGRAAVLDITIDGADGSGGGATLFGGRGSGGGSAAGELESVANPALSRRGGGGNASPRANSPTASGRRGSVFGAESKSGIALAALRIGATLRGVGLRGHGEGEGAAASAAAPAPFAASQKKVDIAPKGARKGAAGAGGSGGGGEFAFVNPGTQLSAKARMRIAGGGKAAEDGGEGGGGGGGGGGFMSPLKASAAAARGERQSSREPAADGDGDAELGGGSPAGSPVSGGAAAAGSPRSAKQLAALSTPSSLRKSRTTVNAAAAAVAAAGAAAGAPGDASAAPGAELPPLQERDGSRALVGLVSGMHTGEGGLSTGLRYLDPLASALYLCAVRALDPARLSAETISDVLAAAPSRLLLRLRPADLPRSQGRVYALPSRNPLRIPLLDGVATQRELGTATLSAALVNFKLPRRLLRTIRAIERLTLGLRDVVKGGAGRGAAGAAGAAASAASILCGDLLACGRRAAAPVDPLPSCAPWCWRLAARHSLASPVLLFDPLLPRPTRVLLAASALLTTLWCAALVTSLAAGSAAGGVRAGGGGFSAGALGVIGLLAALLSQAIQSGLHALLEWGGSGDSAARYPLLAQEMARRRLLEAALSRVSLGRLHQEVAAGIAPDSPTAAAPSRVLAATPGVRSNPLASRRGGVAQRAATGSPLSSADDAGAAAASEAAAASPAAGDNVSPLSASKRRARGGSSKKGGLGAGADAAAGAASPARGAAAEGGGAAVLAPGAAAGFSPLHPPLPAVLDEDDALRFGWQGASGGGAGAGGGCLSTACAPLLRACGRHPSQRAAFLTRQRAAELERGLDREAFESLDEALVSSPRSSGGGRRGGGKGAAAPRAMALAGWLPWLCGCFGTRGDLPRGRRQGRGGGGATQGAFGGTDDAAPSLWAEHAPPWLQWWVVSWSRRGLLAHGVLLGWLAWVSAYLCVWGRFHADGPAGQLLTAWAVGVAVVLAGLEPAAALGAPLALYCALGCARVCRLLLAGGGVGGGGGGAAAAFSRFTLDGAQRASPLTLRLRFVTILRAAGHASGLRPHTAFVALAPTWLLVALATSPPPPPAGAEAALQAATTARSGGGGGRPLTKAAQAQLQLAAAGETRRALSLKRYSLALLRSVAGSMKA